MDEAAFREAVSDRPAAADSAEAPREGYAAGLSEIAQPETSEGTYPDDEFSPGEEQAPPPAPNWDADDNPYKQHAAQLAAERDRYAQAQQQALYQQAEQAWNNAEVQFKQQTSGMDAYERAEALERFYKQREQGLRGAYGELQNQTRQYQTYLTVQQQAQSLVSHYQLPEDDAESLMAIGAIDPGRMQIEAERRAKSHHKTKELEERLARLERGEERDTRVRSGADRFGGRGGNLPRKREYDGSPTELIDILRRDGVLDQLTGR